MSNLLDYLLPNGGGVLARSNGSGELGMQIDATQRNLTYRDQCTRLVPLPTNVSAESVVKAEGFAENQQASADLLRRQSSAQIKAANALASKHETVNSHAIAMGRVNNRLQNSDLRYVEGSAMVGLQTKVAASKLNGFQQAYQGSMSAMQGW